MRKLSIFLMALFAVSMAYAQNPNELSPTPGASQKMSSQERSFLIKLSENIKNEAIASHLHSIVETLDNSLTLEKPDYDFLMDLSGHIKNEKISGVIAKIAEEHHPQ